MKIPGSSKWCWIFGFTVAKLLEEASVLDTNWSSSTPPPKKKKPEKDGFQKKSLFFPGVRVVPIFFKVPC